jgi:NitT/TauT family transport system substrate-binding protein
VPSDLPIDRRTALKVLAGAGGLLAGTAFSLACGETRSAVPASSSSPAGTTPPTSSGAAPAASPVASRVEPLGTVRYGVTPTADAPTWIPIEKGYFEEQGIQLELINVATASEAVPSLGTGQIDVGNGAPGAALFNAFQRGVGIRLVAEKGSAAPGRAVQAIVVRKDLYDSGAVRGPADLSGRRLAMPTISGSASENVIHRYMQTAGLRARDIDLLSMGFPDMAVALAGKAIDAAWMLEPFMTHAVDNGDGVVLLREDEIFPYHTSTSLLYSDVFIREKPELARRFMVAHVKGLRFFADATSGKDPEKFKEMVDILLKVSPIRDRTIYERMRYSGPNPDGNVNIDGLKDDQEYFIMAGVQTERADIDQLVDLGFSRYAVEQLGGPYRPPQ